MQSGIPWLVHWLLIGPKIRRYDRRYMQPLHRVIAGAEDANGKGLRGSAKKLMSMQVIAARLRP